MNDDLDALLREHYRRAAEGIVPDAELVERVLGADRPPRARSWPRVLAAAAAITVVTIVTWNLALPTHSVDPSVPPVAPSIVSSSERPARPPSAWPINIPSPTMRWTRPSPVPLPRHTKTPPAIPSTRPSVPVPRPKTTAPPSTQGPTGG